MSLEWTATGSGLACLVSSQAGNSSKSLPGKESECNLYLWAAEIISSKLLNLKSLDIRSLEMDFFNFIEKE